MLDVAKAVVREICLALNPYVAAGGAQNQWPKIPSLEARKRKKMNQNKPSNGSQLWAVLFTRRHSIISRDIFDHPN